MPLGARRHRARKAVGNIAPTCCAGAALFGGATLPDADLDAATLLYIATLAAVGQLAIDVDHLGSGERKDRKLLEPVVLVENLHHGKGTGEAEAGIVGRVEARR